MGVKNEFSKVQLENNWSTKSCDWSTNLWSATVFLPTSSFQYFHKFIFHYSGTFPIFFSGPIHPTNSVGHNSQGCLSRNLSPIMYCKICNTSIQFSPSWPILLKFQSSSSPKIYSHDQSHLCGWLLENIWQGDLTYPTQEDMCCCPTNSSGCPAWPKRKTWRGLSHDFKRLCCQSILSQAAVKGLASYLCKIHSHLFPDS